MESNTADRLLTAEEIADYLGYSVRTIYDKVQRDQIPHIRLGRTVRFRRAQIDAWIAGEAA